MITNEEMKRNLMYQAFLIFGKDHQKWRRLYSMSQEMSDKIHREELDPEAEFMGDKSLWVDLTEEEKRIALKNMNM